jgi:hypothetical protein
MCISKRQTQLALRAQANYHTVLAGAVPTTLRYDNTYKHIQAFAEARQ